MIAISWENTDKKNYAVNLFVLCEDRPGLLHNISAAVKQIDLMVSSIQTYKHSENNTVIFELSIKINNTDSLEEIMRKMRQIAGVISITRK